MSIKPDKWIIRMCSGDNKDFDGKPMIDPWEKKAIRERKRFVPSGRVNEDFRQEGHWAKEKVVSYGPSSYGYDIRVANEFKIFSNLKAGVIDPKNFDPELLYTIKGEKCIIPPNSFMLARTIEYFRIPRMIMTIILGKSTYARCGLIVNCTPAEPMWEGHLTIEISNTTPSPATIYANEGIAQCLFFESDEECDVSYKDKGGKYDKQQAEIVLPKM